MISLAHEMLAEYHCHKHGNQGPLTGVSFYHGPDQRTNYCLDCFKELIAAHCCELTKLPATSSDTEARHD